MVLRVLVIDSVSVETIHASRSFDSVPKSSGSINKT